MASGEPAAPAPPLFRLIAPLLLLLLLACQSGLDEPGDLDLARDVAPPPNDVGPDGAAEADLPVATRDLAAVDLEPGTDLAADGSSPRPDGGPDRDQDGDQIPDGADNCPQLENPEQEDLDGDLLGDACDLCPWHADPGNDPARCTPQLELEREPEVATVLPLPGLGVGFIGAPRTLNADQDGWLVEIPPGPTLIHLELDPRGGELDPLLTAEFIDGEQGRPIPGFGPPRRLSSGPATLGGRDLLLPGPGLLRLRIQDRRNEAGALLGGFTFRYALAVDRRPIRPLAPELPPVVREGRFPPRGGLLLLELPDVWPAPGLGAIVHGRPAGSLPDEDRPDPVIAHWSQDAPVALDDDARAGSTAAALWLLPSPEPGWLLLDRVTVGPVRQADAEGWTLELRPWEGEVEQEPNDLPGAAQPLRAGDGQLVGILEDSSELQLPAQDSVRLSGVAPGEIVQVRFRPLPIAEPAPIRLGLLGWSPLLTSPAWARGGPPDLGHLTTRREVLLEAPMPSSGLILQLNAGEAALPIPYEVELAHRPAEPIALGAFPVRQSGVLAGWGGIELYQLTLEPGAVLELRVEGSLIEQQSFFRLLPLEGADPLLPPVPAVILRAPTRGELGLVIRAEPESDPLPAPEYVVFAEQPRAQTVSDRPGSDTPVGADRVEQELALLQGTLADAVDQDWFAVELDRGEVLSVATVLADDGTAPPLRLELRAGGPLGIEQLLGVAEPGSPAGTRLERVAILDRGLQLLRVSQVGGDPVRYELLVRRGACPATSGMARPVPGELAINEVLVDPQGHDVNRDGLLTFQTDSFVELLSLADHPLDLGGVAIQASDPTAAYRLSCGTRLEPGRALVIFGGGSPQGSFGRSLIRTAGDLPGGLALSRRVGVAGLVVLSSIEGQELQRLEYETEALRGTSLVRDPEGTGSWTLHSRASASNGAPWSPGTRTGGAAFDGLPYLPEDTCEGARIVQLAAGQRLELVGVTRDASADYVTPCAAGERGKDLVYRIEMPADVAFDAQIAGQDGVQPILTARRAPCPGGELIACAGPSLPAHLHLNRTDGTPLDLLITTSGDGGQFELVLTATALAPPPVNDVCPAALLLQPGESVEGTTTGAGNEHALEGADRCLPLPVSGPEVFYRVAVEPAQPLRVRVVPLEPELDLAVYALEACPAPGVACLAGADRGLGGAPEEFTVVPRLGGELRIVVDSFDPHFAGPFLLSLD